MVFRKKMYAIYDTFSILNFLVYCLLWCFHIADDIQIDQSSGFISFKNPNDSFDREREKDGIITLTIVAKDDGTPVKEVETNFTINITDINDQFPVFQEVEYTFEVYQVIILNTELIWDKMVVYVLVS